MALIFFTAFKTEIKGYCISLNSGQYTCLLHTSGRLGGLDIFFSSLLSSVLGLSFPSCSSLWQVYLPLLSLQFYLSFALLSCLLCPCPLYSDFSRWSCSPWDLAQPALCFNCSMTCLYCDISPKGISSEGLSLATLNVSFAIFVPVLLHW